MIRRTWGICATLLAIILTLASSACGDAETFTAESATTSYSLPLHANSNYCNQGEPDTILGATDINIVEQTTYSIICEEWEAIGENGWLKTLTDADGHNFKAFFVKAPDSCDLMRASPAIDEFLSNFTGLGDNVLSAAPYDVTDGNGEVLMVYGYFATNISPHMSDADVGDLAYQVSRMVQDPSIC